MNTTFEETLENLPVATEQLFESLCDKDSLSIIGEYFDAIDTNEYFHCKHDCYGVSVYNFKVIDTIRYKNGKVKYHTVRKCIEKGERYISNEMDKSASGPSRENVWKSVYEYGYDNTELEIHRKRGSKTEWRVRRNKKGENITRGQQSIYNIETLYEGFNKDYKKSNLLGLYEEHLFEDKKEAYRDAWKTKDFLNKYEKENDTFYGCDIKKMYVLMTDNSYGLDKRIIENYT